jgi:hypothetical protein
MGILDNFENAWGDGFEFESSAKHIYLTSETCSNGCRCKTSSDHIFVMEDIDFDQ